MSKSKPDEDSRGFSQDLDAEEIEILEIVGLDDDAQPRTVEEAESEGEEDADEYVLDLEGASEPESGMRTRLLRLQADFENFKKRVKRETEAKRRHAHARLVTQLLPVLDNFERAVAAVPESPEERAFHDGILLIFRQLLDELRKEGLTAIDSLGQPFDPELHEAVATEADTGLPANTIIEELQRGYMLHDRLLRPALVKVSVDGAARHKPHADEEPYDG